MPSWAARSSSQRPRPCRSQPRNQARRLPPSPRFRLMASAPLPKSLALYRALTGRAAPFFERLLLFRAERGKEDAQRLGERRGEASAPRPQAFLVWIHAASVGEANSVLALV